MDLAAITGEDAQCMPRLSAANLEKGGQ